MKTAVLFKAALAVAAAAFVFASCAKEEQESPVNQQEKAGYRFILGDVSTRAVLASGEHGRYGQWESSDQVGSVTVSGSETRCGYNYVNINGTEASFILYRSGGFQGGEKVRVYFPYSASTKSLSAVALKIPAAQQQDGTVFDFDAMPMVSNEYVVPGPSTGTNPDNYPTADINLANLASVAEFRIYTSNSSYKGEKVQSVRFDADEPIAGPFTADISSMDITNPSTLAISGYEATAVTTTVNSASGVQASASSAFRVFMVLAPGSYGGTVTVTTDKAVYKYPLKTSQTFKRSVVRYFKVDLGSCQDRTVKGADAAVTLSKTISQILEGMGMQDVAAQTAVKELKVDDFITMSTTGTTNNGKVYGTYPNQNWRLYTNGGGNLIVTAASGYELVELMFDYAQQGDNQLTFTGPASGVAIAVSGSEVEYKLTSGNMRINAVSITYKKSSGASGPVLVTGSASSITTAEATLTASFSGIDPSHAPQSAAFRWGTSKTNLTEIEYSTDIINTASGSYSVMLASLEENTTYWYQAVMEAWDPEAGKYVDLEGEVKSFKTGQAYAMAPGYLSCYEVPDITVTTGGSGTETRGNSSYYYYNTSSSKRRVVVHTFREGGKQLRNYTVYFDGNKYAPTWTAHAMHGDVWGDNDMGRTSSWTFDPAIPNSWQQKGLKDASTVGYSRGHLVASNYRQLSEGDNGQTFYYTNQAPQWQNGFNSGPWSDMELAIVAKSKTLHSSDTLYVVVGVLYDQEWYSANPTAPKTLPSSDKTSVNVPIPSHFYCCTMLCGFDENTGEMLSASGGAYLMTNESHTGIKYYNSAFTTTIDAIEEKTGFNFFPRVPQDLQSEAEANYTKVF